MDLSPYKSYPSTGKLYRNQRFIPSYIALAMPAIALLIVTISLPGFFKKYTGEDYKTELTQENSLNKSPSEYNPPWIAPFIIGSFGIYFLYFGYAFFQNIGVTIDEEGVSIPVHPGVVKIPWSDVSTLEIRRQWHTRYWSIHQQERKRYFVGLVLKNRNALMRRTRWWYRPVIDLERLLFGPTIWIPITRVDAHWEELYTSLLRAHHLYEGSDYPEVISYTENYRHQNTRVIVTLVLCGIVSIIPHFFLPRPFTKEKMHNWMQEQIHFWAGTEHEDADDSLKKLAYYHVLDSGQIIKIEARPVNYHNSEGNELYYYHSRRRGDGWLQVTAEWDHPSPIEINISSTNAGHFLRAGSGQSDIVINSGSSLPRMYHQKEIDFNSAYWIEMSHPQFANTLLDYVERDHLLYLKELDPHITVRGSTIIVYYGKCPNTPKGVQEALTRAVFLMDRFKLKLDRITDS